MISRTAHRRPRHGPLVAVVHGASRRSRNAAAGLVAQLKLDAAVVPVDAGDDTWPPSLDVLAHYGDVVARRPALVVAIGRLDPLAGTIATRSGATVVVVPTDWYRVSLATLLDESRHATRQMSLDIVADDARCVATDAVHVAGTALLTGHCQRERQHRIFSSKDFSVVPWTDEIHLMLGNHERTVPVDRVVLRSPCSPVTLSVGKRLVDAHSVRIAATRTAVHHMVER